MQRQLRFLQFLRRTLPSLIKKFAYTFSIKAGRMKVLPVLLVNPIKTPGYAGGISELQLQAKTSYAIIILSPPRHKKA